MAYPTPASSEIEEMEMENQRSPLATWDGASSSSTAADSLRCVNKYDVFINHRGEVKKNFASHLYRALLSRGLKPFLDQQNLQEGLPFPSQLEAVISHASLHVAIFSPKYAESRWCLHELVLMLQSGAPIIPVFYHVKPADLRWGVYALSLHHLELKKTLDPQTQQEKVRYDPATIQKWRDALSSVADINGFDLNGKYNGDEVYMIDKIVEHVVKIIKKPGMYVAQHPTGLDEKVTDFEATVFKQQHDAKIQVAGIVGLGGMGKTTLALELFNRMSSKYNKSFFLSDVREKANKSSLHSVQREILRGLTQGLPERELDINNIYEGIGKLEKHLKSYHVLLILDDIDHDLQLEALLSFRNVLRVDSFILRVHSPNLLWLSWRHCPYTRLPSWITIKNLRFLRVEGGVLETLWQGISQVNLNFLSSSVFKGSPMISDGLQSFLLSKCLILQAPLQLQELEIIDASCVSRIPKSIGQLKHLEKIVIECPSLAKLPQEFGDLNSLKALVLHAPTLKSLPNSFGKLRNLYHMDLYTCFQLERLPDSFGSLTNLHSLNVSSCSQLERLPDSFGSLSNLHSLYLSYCRQLERLPDSFGSLSNLHSLDLKWCRKLKRLPDSFGILSNLHSLDLSRCSELGRLPDSFGSLSNLHSLDLKWCFQLERLPDSFGSLTNLDILDLSHFYELERLPDSFGSLSNLHSLDLQWCRKLERLPDSFGSLSKLHRLHLSRCYQLERLPDSFGSLSNLHSLNLKCCSQLQGLPDSFGSLSSLEYFDVSEASNLRISSQAFGNIRTLQHIDLTNCEKVEVWPWQLGHQRSLKVLKLTGTNFMEELPRAFDLPSDLEVLWVGNPLLDTVIPSLGDLRKLKDLHLEFRGELKCLSASVERSNELSWLRVCCCPIIHTSELFYESNVVYPKLKELILEECINLVEVGTLPKALTEVTLIGCDNLRSIEGLCALPRLRLVFIERCNELQV